MEKYYYNKLNILEKKIYRQIYDGILNFSSPICCNHSTHLADIIYAVSYDNPELFYVKFQGKFRCETSILGSRVYLDYLYNKNQVALFNSRLEKLLSVFSKKDDLSTVKKIHDYLIENITYDKGEITKGITDPENHTIVGALVKKTAVCEGFAKAFQFILTHLGIECYFAHGTALGFISNTEIAHGWNVVRINGKYYHIDVTFNACLTSPEMPKVRYDYFCLTDSEMSRDHKWEEKFNCFNTEDNLFIRSKLFFSTENEIADFIIRLDSSKKFFGFRCDVAMDSAEVTQTVITNIGPKYNTGVKVRFFPNPRQGVYYYIIE